ncbi:MAG: hypothetical protein ACQEXQ_29165 [Bacillota bacterium]
MKRILGMAIIAITFLVGSTAYAYSEEPLNKERVPFEKMYFEYGYKSVEDALGECNSHFKRKIKLPFKLPPIPFTHHLARCNQHGDVNDQFEIEYLNEFQGSNNHYMIRVNPAQHKLHKFPSKRDTIRTYKLLNGEVAVYGTTPTIRDRPPLFNVLIFEMDGWQYILSIDKRVEDKVTADVLLEIANSIR